MAKDRQLEVDSLHRQVYELTIQLKEMAAVVAKHVHGIEIGDLVYVCDGGPAASRPDGGLATVERLEAATAHVRFGGESLCMRVAYHHLQKSQL